jgi:hypothetical protein
MSSFSPPSYGEGRGWHEPSWSGALASRVRWNRGQRDGPGQVVILCVIIASLSSTIAPPPLSLWRLCMQQQQSGQTCELVDCGDGRAREGPERRVWLFLYSSAWPWQEGRSSRAVRSRLTASSRWARWARWARPECTRSTGGWVTLET